MPKFLVMSAPYRYFLLLPFFILIACNQSGNQKVIQKIDIEKSIGVVLVNHGSRSATWRNALEKIGLETEDSILSLPNVKTVKTAFMEYTEPSLATQLRACDSMGVTDIIIVPVFLTVSSHSFDDIPTIAGLKEDPQSIESLKLEKIERYTPQARVSITPLLDFAGVMKNNVLRRARLLSKNAPKEGLTLIGYGDATYEKEWSDLCRTIGEFTKQGLGINEYSFGWCGHLVHYNPDSTTAAIERVLTKKENALVIPLLLAVDEQFQINIIGKGVEKINHYKEKVAYQPDALLPDPAINQWIMQISREYVEKIRTGSGNPL